MREFSFVPQTDLSNYGAEKLDILLSPYGQLKKDTSVKEHTPLIGTKSKYGLLKPILVQQKYARDSLAVPWKILFQCHKDMFPNLFRLASVALTVLVQTAICERGFSVQNLI